jgi:hypothetical protein
MLDDELSYGLLQYKFKFPKFLANSHNTDLIADTNITLSTTQCLGNKPHLL